MRRLTVSSFFVEREHLEEDPCSVSVRFNLSVIQFSGQQVELFPLCCHIALSNQIRLRGLFISP